MSKLAVLFPGQGSQYIGMGKNLFDKFDIAKKMFNQVDSILGFKLSELCFSGDIRLLTKTYNAQPAILAVSVIMYALYIRGKGIEPSYLAGHSLGEISALVCSGAIKFDDAIQIVYKRGQLMAKEVNNRFCAMYAIMGADISDLENCCKRITSSDNIVEISNYNGSKQVVISGEKEALDEVCNSLNLMQEQVIPIKVSAPFHTSIMSNVADAIREELLKYSYSDLNIPVLSNVDGDLYKDKTKIVENLSNQIKLPVKWSKCIKYLKNKNVSNFVEVGPGTVLKNLIKREISAKVFSLDLELDLTRFRNL